MSVSTDLHLDAKRDLDDLGCDIRVIEGCADLDKLMKARSNSEENNEGILFVYGRIAVQCD